MQIFVKTGTSKALEYEACGLRWLAQACDDGGADIATIVEQTDQSLSTHKVIESGASKDNAEAFGRSLARTHASGAQFFGQAPPAYRHTAGFMGRAPLSLHLQADYTAGDSWGQWYAVERLEPYLRSSYDRGHFPEAYMDTLSRTIEAIESRKFDAPQPTLIPSDKVARLHGDLWSGNVLWGTEGAVLIDPAAHGGHAESDLAQLTVFGAPYVERIYAAYNEVSALAPGWRERIPLHQLHILLVHVYLFGGSYARQTLQAARSLI
ncbi:MAG: fructosamine kinase family protein [Actinomycetaceae bacterium]|nr:fructosamine kinase family protein [Actinomycetaceae bacterium]